MTDARTAVIEAVATRERLSRTDAAAALDAGRVKVLVEQREYTISPDGTVATRPGPSPELLRWFLGGEGSAG